MNVTVPLLLCVTHKCSGAWRCFCKGTEHFVFDATQHLSRIAVHICKGVTPLKHKKCNYNNLPTRLLFFDLFLDLYRVPLSSRASALLHLCQLDVAKSYVTAEADVTAALHAT